MANDLGLCLQNILFYFCFVFIVSLLVMKYECKSSKSDCNHLVVLDSNTGSSAYFNTVIFLSLHHIPIPFTLFIYSTMSSINIENRDDDRRSPCRSLIFDSKGYSLHVVGLLLLNGAQIVPTPPAPRNGGPFLPCFGQAGQVDPLVGWRCCY